MNTLNASIKALLAKFTDPVEDSEPPHDFLSLLDRILKRELKQEIDFLSQLITESQDQFKQHFLTRCVHRECDPLNTISFSVIPESRTNQLYWQLAELLFSPHSLAEMLKIVLPSLTKQIHIDLTQPFPFVKGKIDKVLQPVLRTHYSLDNLTAKPNLAEFAHYVLLSKTVVDVRDIADYSFNLHRKVYSRLQLDHPPLFKKIYRHNPSFQLLLNDITTYNQQGRTPKQALTELISALKIGGLKISGTEFAGSFAIIALGEFFEFFLRLPADTQKELRGLPFDNSGSTFGYIIDNEIATGSCVETTAGNLERLLHLNQDEPCLTGFSCLTREVIQQIFDRYKKSSSHLKTEKSRIDIVSLPTELASKILATFTPESTEVLIALLAELPIELFDPLFATIQLLNPKLMREQLLNAIHLDFFNLEIKKGLTNALVKYRHRFDLALNDILKPLTDDNLALCVKTIEPLSEKEQLITLKKLGILGNNLLHVAANQPKSVRAILELYPPALQLPAIKEKDIHLNSTLHYAAESVESTKFLIEKFPESERLPAFKAVNKNKNAVLHFSYSSPESLLFILSHYPKSEWFNELLHSDSYGHRFLATVTRFPQTLKSVLQLFPKKEWREKLQPFIVDLLQSAISYPLSLRQLIKLYSKKALVGLMSENHNHNSKILLFTAVSNPESFKHLLSIHPENEHFKLIKQKDPFGYNILSRAVTAPKSLAFLVNYYPQTQRYSAYTERMGKLSSIMHSAANYHESLEILIASLPETERLPAVQIKNGAGETVLQLAVPNHKSVTLILNLYPVEQRIPAIVNLSFDVNNLALLTALLVYIPIDKRLEFFSIKNNDGDTLLHLVRNHHCAKYILENLSDNDRRTLLLMKNNQEMLAIVNALAKPAVFEVILNAYEHKQSKDILLTHVHNFVLLLQRAVENFRNFIPIIERYTNDELSELASKHNCLDESLLLYAAKNQTSFKKVLSMYSADNRLFELKKKNRYKASSIDLALADDKLFEIIVTHLPDNAKSDFLAETDVNGNCLLLQAANNHKILKMVLALYEPNTHLNAFNQRNHCGKTLFHLASSNSESLKILFGYYQPGEYLSVLSATDNDDNNSVFHDMVAHRDSFKFALEFLPIEIWKVAVTLKNKKGNTILHLVNSFENILALLEKLPPSQLITSLREKNIHGETPLFCAKKQDQHVSAMLKALPEQERLPAMHDENVEQQSLFTEALSSSYLLDALINALPEPLRLTVLRAQEANGQPLLQRTNDPDVIYSILGYFNVDERINLVETKNKFGVCPLQLAAVKHFILQKIVNFYPKDQIIRLSLLRFSNGDNLLHTVANNADLLNYLLSTLYPSSTLKLNALKQKNHHGFTVLHKAVSNANSFKFIFGIYPPNEFAQAVNAKNKKGDTLLHLAVRCTESLVYLSNNYPKDKILNAFNIRNKNHRTVLHCAALFPDSLKFVLKFYPIETRLNALLQPAKNGDTVFHMAACNPDSLKVIFDLLPPHEINYPQRIGNNGNTVLHNAAINIVACKMLIALYSPSSLFLTLNIKNINGVTPFDLMIEKIELLMSCLSRLSTTDRITVLQSSSLLLNLLTQPNAFCMLILSFPNEERWNVLKSLLHPVCQHPDLLISILYMLPTKTVLSALKNQPEAELIFNSIKQIPINLLQTSFKYHFFAVCAALYVKGRNTSWSQFFIPSTESQLLNRLLNLTEIEDGRKLIQKYIARQPKSELAIEFSQRLAATPSAPVANVPEERSPYTLNLV